MTVVATDGPEDITMGFQSNIFCWQGISTDVAQGKEFYSNVLGWDVSSDAEGAPMFIAPGGAVAHIQAPEAGPPSWCSFLSVDDLDASTATAAERGSTVLVPPTDLPVGRFSIITTPSGAVFGLYAPAEQDELATRGPGSIHWVELQSTTPDEDVAWLESVFGFSSKTQEMASGPYHVLEAGGVSRGGVTQSRSDTSMFVAWIHVEDLDATLAKVKSHGGTPVTAPFVDPAVGRMAVVADRSGATFGLIQPA